MTRRSTACALSLVAWSLVAWTPFPSLPTAGGVGPDTLRDLRAILDTGVVLQDLNQDRVVDFLSTRILLPPAPNEAELAAAANVAARLGFETSASDLDLLATASEASTYADPVVLVGARALEATGTVTGAAPRLAPGEGALLLLPAGERMRAGGVALVGYDATGLLAVADYLSGRYPAVWGGDGISWRGLAEKLEAFLRERDLETTSLEFDRIVVGGGRAGVTRARASVHVVDEATLTRAEAAFAERAEPADSGAAGGEEATVTDTTLARGAAPSSTGLADLRARDLGRLDVRLVGPAGEHIVSVRPEHPWDTRADPDARPGSDFEGSLPDLYTIRGLYRDTNGDLVPDESRGYVSLQGAAAPTALVGLATRLGLETAGLRLPLVKMAGESDDPEALGFPVLVGREHYQTRHLRERDRLALDALGPGVGTVELVPDAFEDRSALVVTGADDAGLEAALDWLGHRAPYLWTYGKGETALVDLQTEVRRFFQARSAPGQISLALAKLGTWMERRANDPPTRVEVEIAAREAPPGLGALTESVVHERFPDAAVSVETWPTGFGVGDTIFVQDFAIPWEVDEARGVFEREVLPRVRPGEPARVEIRVSEPPAVRRALAAELRAALVRAGVRDPQVRVLNAYKQGYSWLDEVVLPRLRGADAATIEIRYHTLEESEEVRWQTIAADTRWLQEIYPIDAVLSRELGLPDSSVTFHATRRAEPIYEVVARDAEGQVILRERFDPHYVVRPFFDLFPEYEQVRVTTGWITASVGADTLVDRRVETDPERFWDRLQNETYARIADYVMDIQDGRPSPANAPYFDEFQVGLRLSEPNGRIGIDEEVISSLEALHEDIYFETLTLFDLIGARYQTSLPYPGRVLPRIDPTGAGRPGAAHITLTGKRRAAPELVVRTWTDEGGEPTLQRYALGPLQVAAPELTGVSVDADHVAQLLTRIVVRDSLDRYEEFEGRSSEAAIDGQFMNVELMDAMLAALDRLHAAGLAQGALSWDRVDELMVDYRVESDSTYRHRATLDRGPDPASTQAPHLTARGWTWGGESLTQWDRPVSPAENDSILARLATFEGVDVYHVADSYLGQPVWAVDFLPPQSARYVSQAKLNALKPTLLISGRQHANEVSSTSHILRLGELLATDSTYRALLRRVNVVLHPITNPDGARLAVEMQETNPDFMLHAGYLGALGVDATSGERDDDPIYPESQARRRLRETWLPDIYMNMHGYPSHEWVQYFAGYSAWVRSRRGGQRSWWAPRGWFVPGLSWTDDDEHPDYRKAQFAILDSVAAAITGEPDVDAMNRRLYARYRKYGVQDRDDFTEYFHDGILVNLRLRGQESIGNGLYSPRITYFATTTEAPDETARGAWLDLVARAGLAHSSALLRYLASGEFEVERKQEASAAGVTRKVYRVKPVLPKGTEPERPDPPGGGR